MLGLRNRRSSDAILLSGATGFLGMELLLRCLERSERHVYALVRADDQPAATERVRGVIEEMFGSPDAHQGRWSAVAGDIEAPGLGLEAEQRQCLAGAVAEILHSAASVSF